MESEVPGLEIDGSLFELPSPSGMVIQLGSNNSQLINNQENSVPLINLHTKGISVENTLQIPLRLEDFIDTTFTTENSHHSQTESQRSFERKKALRDLFDRGETPAIGNGFSFVIDTRPEGHEDDDIPPQPYTRYFSERKIPIAAPGHRQRRHDIDHSQSYEEMFWVKPFADMVQDAALNALKDPEKCKRFTGAMDSLGDAMRNWNDGYFRDKGTITAVRYNLEQLVSLKTTDGPEGKALFDEIWNAFQMPYKEAEAKLLDDLRRKKRQAEMRGRAITEITKLQHYNKQ